MSFNLFIQSLIDGLLMGGIYGIVALGLTLIFGVMKIINFAQGSFLMLGMYVTYWSVAIFEVNPYLTIPISAIILFLIGILIQRTVLSRMIDAPEHNQLLVTMGLMLVIENAILIAFSPDFRSVEVPGLATTLNMLSISINLPRLIAFCFAVVSAITLFWFLKSTMIGKAIRATSMQRNGASIVGINTKRINYITFGLGASIAGIAGTLLTPVVYTSPYVGETFILKAFVVVVLGGLGNFVGALVGGLIIGVAESIGGALFEGTWKELMTYLIFILVLLFRPKGLFGGKAK